MLGTEVDVTFRRMSRAAAVVLEPRPKRNTIPSEKGIVPSRIKHWKNRLLDGT